MLDWRRWTLTHSSGWAAELALGLGVAAMRASCEAESVLDDADPDGAEDEDPDPDPDVEGDRSCDADGELGWAAVSLAAGEVEGGGSLLGGSLGELLLGEGEGDGDGEGDGEGDGDGEGEGDGEAEAGRAWHTMSESDAGAAPGLAAAACAVPSMLRVRKLPLSTVTAATRTCAKRISGLSPLLVRVYLSSLLGIRRCCRGGWVSLVISSNRLHIHHTSSSSQPSR
jgi:hypothetical protein